MVSLLLMSGSSVFIFNFEYVIPGCGKSILNSTSQPNKNEKTSKLIYFKFRLVLKHAFAIKPRY